MSQDFSILGGNVAGVGAALNLRKKLPDASIRVYEPKIFNKPCGGAISIEWCEYLKQELDVSLDESYHAAKMRTGLWSGRYVEVESPFVLTSRFELQEKLVERAREEKIEIIQKQVKLSDESVFSPQTIVATGFSGLTRQLMQQDWNIRDITQIVRFDGHVSVEHPDSAFIILDNKQVGYGWLFVGSEDHINVGLGGLGSPKMIKARYYEFLDLLNQKFNVIIPPEKVKPQGWGLPIPINKWKYKVSNNLQMYPNVEFIGVGDAIGLAHPILGAGIEPAWQSSWILAECYDDSSRKIDINRYKSLLKRNLALSSSRRLDRTLASIMRNKWVPWKDKFGYIALKLLMNRMIRKMRQYPWYAFVADENGPLELNRHLNAVKQGKPIINY
ncbi:MAG: NAD(P)/FAD-dependent oxidoreductase [Candidatus Hodarchaeales archaeon]